MKVNTVLFRLFIFGLSLAAGLSLLVAIDFDIERILPLIRETRPIYFILMMSVLPLVGFPIAVFYLFAGSAYVWWHAWAFCTLALAINISISYPIARYLLASPISALLSKYDRSLPELTKRNQFRVTFLVRSIPGVPYFIQNYMLAVLGVDFVPYFVISLSIQSIFAAGMAAVPHLVEETGWLPVAMVAGIMGLLLLLRRIFGAK
ncbi:MULTISPECIES: TVP38/TMEM64 family protein [unclassified Lentimonas]|uniref:TVP38/TMEM64 family protein n=1 Tax=unclassified Lentimonas TaxID=2630993 RepID=UPI00132533C3|nr:MULTISPECIES: VTT domain-containing protein [unclassified Lentimonas]CAA6679614.1 Unannotated [Lentimonas sp. CC4]CAA6687332.1 Unannotated [Lentimonas sp. CC6]CAA6694599.1 Unannotated [Lentimonas sp. CC19]CAA6696547.1 Unannotated [Lentimonas sp. CC10]CAA7071374.1 Unannotated [Lentimonas sp. CC11]